METKDLEKLGLTQNEATVYSALLELGSVSAGPIVKKTRLHRNIVYINLDKLIDKGLVTYVIQANRKYFEAAAPNQIIRMLEEQEQEIKKKQQLMVKLLPEIEAKRKISKESQEATIYKGTKGIISALDDILKVKEPILIFGASAEMVAKIEYFYRYYFPKWHNLRVKAKIPLKMIFSEDNRKRGEDIKQTSTLVLVSYIPKEFCFPISIAISGSKLVIMTWSEEPLAFLIRSKDVAEGMKAYFRALWKIAKR